jgi:hypothetical protein
VKSAVSVRITKIIPTTRGEGSFHSVSARFNDSVLTLRNRLGKLVELENF